MQVPRFRRFSHAWLYGGKASAQLPFLCIDKVEAALRTCVRSAAFLGNMMDVTTSLRCSASEKHSVCDLNVYEVKGHLGTNSLQSDDHLVVLMNDPGKLSVFWEGGSKLCNEVMSGDLIYIPASSTVSCEHDDAVNSAFIKLKQSTISMVAAGHVDHSLIDFSGRHVRQKAASSLAAAVVNVGITKSSLGWPMLVESATMSLATAMIAALAPGASTAFKEKPYGLSDFRMKRLTEFIEANLHRPVTLAEMAELCTVSQFHFTRLFKKRTGMTPMKFIGIKRVERSKKMLQSTGLTLAQISHDCGFSSQSHFTGVFRLDTGITPAAYRRSIN